MHRHTLGWMLVVALGSACEAREQAQAPRDAATTSAVAPPPAGGPPPPTVGEAPATPAERALPDAGLTLQPMVQPGAGTIPEQRLELQVPSPAGAAGFRAPQNDAPPPTKPVLRTPHRPYSPAPPRPDSQGRMPAPKLDPNAPTVPVQPKGPSNANAPPADR